MNSPGALAAFLEEHRGCDALKTGLTPTERTPRVDQLRGARIERYA
jgi:hypothetical protein